MPSLRFAIIFSSLAMLQGCVSFQGDPLPRTATVGEIESLAKNFEFDYMFRHHHGGEDHDHKDAEADAMGFVIERTLKRIGAVDSHSINKGLLKFRLVQEEEYSSILGFLSTITLFIIPSYGEDLLNLIVTYEEGGKVIYKVKSSSSVNSLYQVFLLFAMPFTSAYVIEKNLRYLTEDACYQMMKKMGLETLRKE
jgi:hypothetical protein